MSVVKRKQGQKSDLTFGEKFSARLIAKGRELADWLRINEPHKKSDNVANAETLANRSGLSDMLPFVDLSEDGIMVSDTMQGLRQGFMIEFQPFTSVGTDAEGQIESLIGNVTTPGAVIQFGVWGSRHVKPSLDEWRSRRSGGENKVISSLAGQRADFFLAAAHRFSLIAGKAMSPRKHRYFLTVTVPYTGSTDSTHEWEIAHEQLIRIRASILGTLKGMGLYGNALDRKEVREVMTGLLNPHISPEVSHRDEQEFDAEHKEFGLDKGDQKENRAIDIEHHHSAGLVNRESRISVLNSGHIRFKASDSENEKREAFLSCITVDGYPRNNYLPLTNFLINGHPAKGNERISQEFFAYINIQIQDSDKASDRLAMKLAGVSKQLVSESQMMRSLMEDVYEQRDHLRDLVAVGRDGHQMVAAYMGVNILSRTARDADEAVSEVSTFWKGYGFKATQERFIALPAYLSSLPFYFYPGLDPVTSRGGLQRSSSMASSQASYLALVRGEWNGTPPSGGGLLLTSRRGQVVTMNVQDKDASSNYNFTIVAGSGSGKSFIAQEIVMDFLARDGYAFIIDAGKSYYELAEVVGGVNLVFNMDDPMDLNPFAPITSESRLHATIEMLKELIRFMAFPNTASGGIPDWQDAVLEHAIEASWHEHGDKTWVGNVADWLQQHDDERARDMAVQLRPYTEGRLARWFNGEGRKIDLQGKLIVIEMDELKGQGGFRNVALTMMMQRIADAMYAGDSSVPKLMLIDEAWDLLGNADAGDFIERAYRTYRKYGGSAGVITQSFADFKLSKAAEAAYANSSWTFSMRQKPESLEAAFRDGRVMADEQLKEVLRSVTTLQGEFSEVWIRCDSGSGVYRFIADPATYWLFTTSPRDKGIRNRMIESIMAEKPGIDRVSALAEAVKRLGDEATAKRFGLPPDKILEELAQSAQGELSD